MSMVMPMMASLRPPSPAGVWADSGAGGWTGKGRGPALAGILTGRLVLFVCLLALPAFVRLVAALTDHA
ncbi:hypothetical protein [Streptomyces sp. AK010]|uniref:hypothetical protein n=1 Tax=Streptomyces sp. AK010 TaxID=2723074 RepID=UPI00160C25E9|nr:hypothetical protein [Streptomyces sp. AK010]MBB6416180.1 hypothetical protein [Streptomyces sp. AK010]